MIAKLKNIGRKLNLFSTRVFICLKTLPNSYRLSIFFSLILLMLFFPLYYANAIIIPLLIIGAVVAGGSIIATVTAKVTEKILDVGLLVAILFGIQAFSLALLRIAISLFQWAISNPFGLSMTNPSSNRIIEIGWTATRDLTNMFFILGLAYIGLATALSLGNFNTKKTFVRLMIVALLVNFTPVLCGVVVDFANIVMRFFMGGIDFTNFLGAYLYGEEEMSIWDLAGNVLKLQFIHPNFWFKWVLLNFYSFAAALVFLIFAILFIMRNVLMWILVIVSPLAFFASIFSQGKKWFDKWMGYFTSWTFIGVAAGFLLYLANHFVALIPTLPKPTGGNWVDRFFAQFIPHIVATCMMWGALFATFKINAAGSTSVVGGVKKIYGQVRALPQKAGKKVGEFAGAAAGAYAGSVTAGALAGFKGGYGAMRGTGAGRLASLGGGLKGWVARSGFGFKRSARMEGVELMEESRKKVYEAGEKLGVVEIGEYEAQRAKKMKADEEMKLLKGASADKKDALYQKLVEKGVASEKELKQLIALLRLKIEDKNVNATKTIGTSGKTDINVIVENAKFDYNLAKDASKIIPEKAAEFDPKKFTELQAPGKGPGGATLTADQAKQEMINQVINKQTARQVQENIVADSLKVLEVVWALSADQVKEIAEKGTSAQRKAIDETLQANKGTAGLINNRYNALVAAGQLAEAERLKKMIIEAHNNVNLVFSWT